MTLSANTVWEVETGGNDANGGGFVTGASGTDYSQQSAAQYALSGLTTAAANAIILTASAAADMVGNIINITGGTNFTVGRYQITAVSVGVSITVDRTCTTAAGAAGTANVGGALATPGQLGAVYVAGGISGQQAWIKSGTYTLSGSTANTSGGPVDSTGFSAVRFTIEGYNTVRGDRAGRPELNAGAQTSVTLWKVGGTASQKFTHVAANGNSKSAVSGFVLVNTRAQVFDCTAINCDQSGTAGFTQTTTGSLMIVKCKASSCLIGFSLTASISVAVDCWADACGTGFSLSATTCALASCLASDCTGVGFITSIGSGATFINCTADGNASDGFGLTGSNVSSYCNACVSSNNGGFGYNTVAQSQLENCASYNNTSGRVNAATAVDRNSILLSADPWVNGAADDYRPNSTAGGGAAIRALASGVAGQTNARDVGAVQHTDSGGGSTSISVGIIGG